MSSGVGSSSTCCRLYLISAVFITVLVLSSIFVSAEPPNLKNNPNIHNENVSSKVRSGYQHVWPEMKFGWRIVVGTLIGFFGAACGSVAGAGGGGIFVPMFTLIAGFDAKSSAALSKCMVTGAAAATVFYNVKKRHPTLEIPVIDYDLALLFQPMLVLGISIGVGFNVIFADWMITILLIILFLVMSIKAFLKGVETWKKETATLKVAGVCYLSSLCITALVNIEEGAKSLESGGTGIQAEESKCEPESATEDIPKRTTVSLIENVRWKELGLLVAVWVVILALQIAKNYTTTCSWLYWVLNILQIPVAGGVTAYEAVSLYQGRRRIESKGEIRTNWSIYKLVLYCSSGLLAGMVGGLLGVGGGFILSPLFLELGIPPQVSSATSTFAMVFSASMSVIEYYLLKRFPMPYALYFFCVATVAAFLGQHLVRKLIKILGRASIIIFVLAFIIFISTVSLGGVGVAKMVGKIEHKAYMGFDNICSYNTAI